MTDDKADDITEAEDDVVSTGHPGAQPSDAPVQSGAQAHEDKLTGLMAGSAVPPARHRDSLEDDALHAAQHAVDAGNKAIADANAQLHEVAQATAPQSSSARVSREFVLRVLLTVNVLALIAVLLVPAPISVDLLGDNSTGTAPQSNKPMNRAMHASENRDYVSAVAILEAYLQGDPPLNAAQKLSLMTAISHYASRNNDFVKARLYAQQAQAIAQSHSLSEDLVQAAEAAVKSGDQASLRRIWEAALLQQQQIPTWLYQHVARAYLQLADGNQLDGGMAAESAARMRTEVLKAMNLK